MRNLQAKYDSVRDFSADFEHRYSGGVLRTSIVEHGTVLVKKPGKMRWRYTRRRKRSCMSPTARSSTRFFPSISRWLLTEVPPDDQASTSALFLAGKGSLADDFTAAYANEPEAPDSWIVRLTPETSGADYEWLTLTVDRESLAITGLSTEDLQGGRSSYLFTNLVENRGVPDSAFDFEIPRERRRHQAGRSNAVALRFSACLPLYGHARPKRFESLNQDRYSPARPFPTERRD